MVIAMANGEDDDINAMKKVDDKYFEENDKYLYWNTFMMMTRIRTAMDEEIGPGFATKWNTLWYALRLKFTDDIIREEATKFLNGDFDYRREIYGYKIYDIMKEYATAYPVALLKIYSLVNNNKDESGYTLVRQIVDFGYIFDRKIVNSKLNDNGTIEYYPAVHVHKTQEELEKEHEELRKKVLESRKRRGIINT